MGETVEIFIAGVQKAGTSSLHEYLKRHPGLQAPGGKELHFFDDEAQDWQHPDYAKLHGCFPAAAPGRARFESTPIYSFWPPSLARIQAYNPQARLILLFRDPFERALSQWYMEFARGDETLSFAEAIRGGRERLRAVPALAREARIFSYVERGDYAGQFARALALFPRGQILCLRAEDLRRHAAATLRQIAAFLDLPAFPNVPDMCENRRPEIAGAVPPTRADLKIFHDQLGDSLAAFGRLAELDISAWPTVTNEWPAAL